MNDEFFDALDLLEKERGIPKAHMLEKVGLALEVAVKRDYGSNPENISVKIDDVKREILVSVLKSVVEEVEDKNNEISLEDAKRINKKYEIGDIAEVDIKTKNFGRISAQTAKQVIIQGIREAERGMLLQEFTSKEFEIISAVVNRVDPVTRNVTLEIGKAESVLIAAEQIPGEYIREGEHIKVYVVEVKKTNKGPQIMLSRTHPGLVKRLLELEVPEIYDGTVEIKGISREPGSRTKISVHSTNDNVDAIGACIGPKGSRIGIIIDELKGEKIDIVRYNEETEKYVAAALAPAEVLDVELVDGEKGYRVVVPDDQLSLAIGKEGQNARLAAKLTGCKIDIQPQSKGY